MSVHKTAITTNGELYATIKGLVHRLRDAGENELAADLQKSLYVSSLPGDILTATRAALERVYREPVVSMLHLESPVYEALAYVDSALTHYYR